MFITCITLVAYVYHMFITCLACVYHICDMCLSHVLSHALHMIITFVTYVYHMRDMCLSHAFITWQQDSGPPHAAHGCHMQDAGLSHAQQCDIACLFDTNVMSVAFHIMEEKLI